MLHKLQKLFLASTVDTGFWVGERLGYVDLQAGYLPDCERPFAARTRARFAALCHLKRHLENRSRLAGRLCFARRPAIVSAMHCPLGGTPETS